MALNIELNQVIKNRSCGDYIKLFLIKHTSNNKNYTKIQLLHMVFILQGTIHILKS